jgi:hypothetical protein
MSTVTDQRRKTSVGTVVLGGAAAVAVMAAVAVSGNYLWQKQAGPTQASKADCVLAQQLFDRAQAGPGDATKAAAWETEIRQIRYTKLADEGLSTQVGKYVYWATVKATGAGEKPTVTEVDKVLKEAKGHCGDSGVNLVIPVIEF